MTSPPTTPAWALALLDTDLTAIERVVLAYLAWRQGGHGEAWPSQRTIAEDLGLTEDGVRKIVRRLEASGRLVVKRPVAGRGRRIQYTVTPTKPQTAIDPSSNQEPPTDSGGSSQETPDSRLQKPQTAKPRHIRRTLQGTQKMFIRTFVPPSVADVVAYAHSIGFDLDAGRFIDHYVSNGWCVGKAQMKDWQAAVRNWQRTDAEGVNGKRIECATRDASDEEAEDYRRITAAYQARSGA